MAELAYLEASVGHHVCGHGRQDATGRQLLLWIENVLSGWTTDDLNRRVVADRI
jgi:hypothetical protein